MAATDTLIKEFFGTFREFIYRDLFYVVGGAAVLLSGSLAFDIPIRYTGWSGLYIAVLGYVVGYSLQETWSVLGLVTTAYKGPPNKFISWACKRFNPSEAWNSLPSLKRYDLKALRHCLDNHCGESCQKHISRTVNLKQLGSSMSSSLLVTTVILVIGAIRHTSDSWYIPLAVCSFVLALLLILINRIKQVQQSLMELEVNQLCKECKGSAIKEEVDG